VQDGCDNRCTFCITTVARGQGVSISAERILGEINAALEGGTQEVVLTGVHLGSWGQDLERSLHLRDLVEKILNEAPIVRLRLSSLEPWDLDEDFFALWQDERLARHIHLPLQSGSAATLRRMARKTTPKSFAKLVDAARIQIPNVAITTDVITGFPGETEQEFEASVDFVRQMEFAGGHVFTYSERPGTAASKMPDQVPHPIRKARNAVIRKVLENSAQKYRTHFVGEKLSVLWETASLNDSNQWLVSGLTDNYLRVTAQASRRIWNQITPVQLTGTREGGLIGQILRL
jgi:threonylcarbamoyladenosine tRNA methylthiotransferase MtaB